MKKKELNEELKWDTPKDRFQWWATFLCLVCMALTAVYIYFVCPI